MKQSRCERCPSFSALVSAAGARTTKLLITCFIAGVDCRLKFSRIRRRAVRRAACSLIRARPRRTERFVSRLRVRHPLSS